MNCRSAESLYSSFLEDEVSQEERRSLETHLLGCRRCSMALRELRATVTLMHQLPEVAPSAHFDEDLFARIRSGEGLRPGWSAFAERIRALVAPLSLRPVLATGVAACAIAVAVVTLHPGRPAPTKAAAPADGIAQRATEAPGPSGSIAPAPEVVTVVQRPATFASTAAARPSRTTAGTASSVARGGEPGLADPNVVGDRLEPQYQDEYILDQFLLERTGDGQSPAVVPVNDAGRDVYITF